MKKTDSIKPIESVSSLLVILVGLMASCAPVKRSQVILIGNYYNTIAEHPSHLKKLREKQAALVLEADNLKSALFKSDSLRVASLMHAIQEYEEHMLFPDSILEEINDFESYIRGYYLLAPNGFNIYRTLKSTSVSVVGVFGLGPVANSVIPDKNVEVSTAKKRKIHAHFSGKSASLEESLTRIKTYVDDYIIPEIDKTSDRIRSDVQILFTDQRDSISSIDHYFNYNRFFIDYFEKISATRRLAGKISESLEHIVTTEREIHAMTRERQKIQRDSRQLHLLADDLERIRELQLRSDAN